MLVLGLGLFTACSDDNDSNPTVKEPTTFVLNTPALANAEIDLANSDVLELTCSQPNYGFPARTLYHVQVAVEENGFENGKFRKRKDTDGRADARQRPDKHDA